MEQCKLLKNIIIPKEIGSLLLLNNIGYGVQISYKGSMKELLAVFEKTGSISYSGNIKCNNRVLHVKISNKGRFFKEEYYIPTKEDLEHVSYLINNNTNEKVEKDHKIKATKTIISGFPVYLGNNQKINSKKSKDKIDKNQKKQRFIDPCFPDDRSVTDEEFLKAVNNIANNKKELGDIFSAKVEIIKDDYIIVSTPNLKKEDEVLKENLLHSISSYKVGSHIRLKVISMNPLRLKEFDGDNSLGELDKPLLQSIDDKDNKVFDRINNTVNNNNDSLDFIDGLSNELQKNECINRYERIEKKDKIEELVDKIFNLLEFDEEEKTNNDDSEEDDYLF